MLDENFSDHPDMQSYIKNRIPKYGTNNPEVNEFSRKVLEDLSTVAGQPNGRGGAVTPAFYVHNLFRQFGLKTKATPDGRRMVITFQKEIRQVSSWKLKA